MSDDLWRVSDILRIAPGRVVALDAKTGDVLFDTRKNKGEYIEQFMHGEVLDVWTDLKTTRHRSKQADSVLMMYVSYDSWKEGKDNG